MGIDKKSMIIEAAIMYYERNMTQNEIAEEMNISRSYVSQLLNMARETKIVHFHVDVDEYSLRMIREEMEFKARWPSLKRVYIMQSENEDFTAANIGKFAAPYIAEMISDASMIGINPGLSVERAVNCLATQTIKHRADRRVVQIMGGFNSSNFNAFSEPNGIALKLGKVLGCEASYVNCPAILTQDRLRERLIREDSISQVLKLWDETEIAIMGLGTVKNSNFFNLFPENIRKQILEAGVTGFINTNFFNSKGEWISLYEDHKIGISVDQFKKIKNKVVICSGPTKSLPLISALRGGHIDTLIVDSIAVDELNRILASETA
jgi:DNA-binding transcriptional regulator LsrR (DeoR family)